MAKKKAKLSNLKTATHKGRPARTGSNFDATSGYGLTGTSLRGDSRITAPILTRIPSTPPGPESHLP